MIVCAVKFSFIIIKNRGLVPHAESGFTQKLGSGLNQCQHCGFYKGKFENISPFSE
jgi:hypothetical protein